MRSTQERHKTTTAHTTSPNLATLYNNPTHPTRNLTATSLRRIPQQCSNPTAVMAQPCLNNQMRLTKPARHHQTRACQTLRLLLSLRSAKPHRRQTSNQFPYTIHRPPLQQQWAPRPANHRRRQTRKSHVAVRARTHQNNKNNIAHHRAKPDKRIAYSEHKHTTHHPRCNRKRYSKTLKRTPPAARTTHTHSFAM